MMMKTFQPRYSDDDVFTSNRKSEISTKEGGKYDFDDGGTYRGKWKDGKAHGLGVCTGPGGQGKFSGVWENGFEILGLYEWPNGDMYFGDWSKGYRHHLGMETREGWTYKGEWEAGVKGTHGVLINPKGVVCYEGKWKDSLKNGLGTETYGDGGTYKGEWVAGKRHGIGVRKSAPYSRASTRRCNFSTSLDRSEFDIRSESSVSGSHQRTRNGFVLDQPTCSLVAHINGRSTSKSSRKKSILSRMKSKSTLGAAYSLLSLKSSKSSYQLSKMNNQSGGRNSNHHQQMQFNSFDVGDVGDFDEFTQLEDDVIETYYGEWMNNSRHGHGVCQRSDGMTYEGQWVNDQRHGYGVTSYSNGQVFEGYYKMNAYVGTRRQSILSKTNKEKIMNAVVTSNKAKSSAMKIAEHVATCVYQCRTIASRVDQVASNARKHAKSADKVAYEINRKSLKNKKAFTLGEEINREPEIVPTKHLPTTCQTSPSRKIPPKPKPKPPSRPEPHHHHQNGIDKIIPDIPGKTKMGRGGRPEAEIIMKTQQQQHHHPPPHHQHHKNNEPEKLKRNFFRPFRSKHPATEARGAASKQEAKQHQQPQKQQPHQQKHHQQQQQKNRNQRQRELDQQMDFDWRSADARSRRKQWATQTSAARNRNPGVSTSLEKNKQAGYSSLQLQDVKEEDYEYDDRMMMSYAELQVHALKPRNSKAAQRAKVQHQTIDQIAQRDSQVDDFDYRNYSSLNIEDLERNDGDQGDSEQNRRLQMTTVGRGEFILQNQQYRNVYQMILVFVINVGFVFMILRIPST